MTTIAWDGRTLAADTRATNNGYPSSHSKIYALPDGRHYAGCGSAGDVIRIVEWLQTGGKNADSPTFEDGGSWGIVVGPGELWSVQGKRPTLIPIRDAFLADGSGRDFAIAAMAFGKTAREAVEFAMRFDVFTGGAVDVVEIGR